MKLLAQWIRNSLAILLFAIGAFAVAGCEDGGFEDAGEEIDEAADDIDDEL